MSIANSSFVTTKEEALLMRDGRLIQTVYMGPPLLVATQDERMTNGPLKERRAPKGSPIQY
jgi:hypothetical protein